MALLTTNGETPVSFSFLRTSGIVLALCALTACAQRDPLNTAGRPDATSGNPPGTVASRALDRTAGTDTSGAYPSQADGTRANPRGTAVSRALGTTNR
jgi:type IV pilus biogenesis protein CpaD/CtpE